MSDGTKIGARLVGRTIGDGLSLALAVLAYLWIGWPGVILWTLVRGLSASIQVAVSPEARALLLR